MTKLKIAFIGAGSQSFAGRTLGDVLLSDAVLRYPREMRTGRVAAKTVYRDVNFPVPFFDFVETVQTALKDGGLAAALNELGASHPEYVRLKDALAALWEEAFPNDPVWNLAPLL